MPARGHNAPKPDGSAPAKRPGDARSALPRTDGATEHGPSSGPTSGPTSGPGSIATSGSNSGPNAAPNPAPSFAIIEPVCAVFRRTLRSEGLKYTPERANVLNVVLGFDCLFEADQVIDRLKSDGFRVSKATVYRTLKLLAEAGIIQRVLIDSEQAHYQLVYGEQRPRHILIRVDTNQVRELDIPEVETLVRRVCEERGLTPASFRLHIFAHL